MIKRELNIVVGLNLEIQNCELGRTRLIDVAYCAMIGSCSGTLT